MPEQTTDELLAEVAEIRRPRPGDTWVTKVLIWFLGQLENRLRAKREHNKSLEREVESRKAEIERLEASTERAKAYRKQLEAICDEHGVDYPGREAPPKTEE